MPNRLAQTSSPYLRMHADNPVAWQPWDAAALAEARDSDTPILLSIGYSACHWCHVMARECFQDPSIAASMNAHFVNIKLDREERPDLDRVYQRAHQALNGRGGGWPLTVFLDPQTLSPFYIGTYFPPRARHGLPAFPDVLQKVAQHFHSQREALPELARSLEAWLRQAPAGSTTADNDAEATAAQALERLRARFDPDWGGSRGAPKFPRGGELEWLLDRPEADARLMARVTLERMARRGLQDHLGGGFFRYCVDASWTIPHFEKMLSDNAQLLAVYARLAADHDADSALRDVAQSAVDGIAGWLTRNMSTPDSAFCSALGADSEGAEGRFYLWSREQFDAALPETLQPIASAAFGLDQAANFEGVAWHLLRAQPLDEVAQRLAQPAGQVNAAYEAARRQLFTARAQRPRPPLDDKVLTAWNALAIAALARSARLLGHREHASMAQRALAALRRDAWIDGALYANATSAAFRIPGFLDDHAFLLDAVLETLQLDFDADGLDLAMALADALCDRFEDPAGGFRFSTPAHQTPLTSRPEWTDDALPNGNGAAILGLLRLGRLLGRDRYLDSAERALSAASGALSAYPDACPTVLRALHEFEHPRTQIVIRSSRQQQAVWQAALPQPTTGTRDAFFIADDAPYLPGLLQTRNRGGANGSAWVCRGTTCQPPVATPAELRAMLDAPGNR